MGLIKDLKRELFALLALAGPTLVAFGSNVIMTMTDSIFVGFIGPKEFAAATIGNAFFGTLLYAATGMSFGMDTLVSQAYGAGNMKLVGVYFQVAIILVTIVSIPICIFLSFSEFWLVLLGQDPELSAMANIFIQYNLIGFWPSSLYFCIEKYLQCQRIMAPAVYVGIIAILLNIPLNYLFIFVFGLGLRGAALATSIAKSTMPILLWAYVWYKKIHIESSPSIYKEAFQIAVIWEYLRYAVPATLMLIFEVVGFNIVVILVGFTQNYAYIDAHAVGFNVIYFVFMFPFSWGISLTIHVGNVIGAGEYQRSLPILFVGLGGLVFFSEALALLIWSLRFQIPKIWSHDAYVLQMATDVLSLASLVVILDSFQIVVLSVLKGLGRQKFGAILNFVGYNLIMIPIGLMLAYFAGLPVLGYWYSLILCLAFTSAVGLFYLYFVDWKEEAELARERVGDEAPEEFELVEKTVPELTERTKLLGERPVKFTRSFFKTTIK